MSLPEMARSPIIAPVRTFPAPYSDWNFWQFCGVVCRIVAFST